MTVRLDTDIRNDILAAINATFDGGSLCLYSGAQPASANDVASGTLIAEVNPLPADSFAAPAAGTMAKSGTWEDPTADNAGVLGWFRLKNVGDTRRIDGSITATGGGGDMTVDNTNAAAGQTVTITSLTVSMPSGE